MSYRVLIVDDSKLARMSVARLLSALRPDWQRVEAANADEALAQAAANSVDVALLDFNMPGRDGLVLAGELLDLRPGMPIALVSANHQREVVQNAAELGAVFLPKPLTQDALDDFVQTAERQLKAAGQ